MTIFFFLDQYFKMIFLSSKKGSEKKNQKGLRVGYEVSFFFSLSVNQHKKSLICNKIYLAISLQIFVFEAKSIFGRFLQKEKNRRNILGLLFLYWSVEFLSPSLKKYSLEISNGFPSFDMLSKFFRKF